MGKYTKKNLFGVGGVIGIVVGLVMAIPSIFQQNYILTILSMFLLVGGIILLAIALGD